MEWRELADHWFGTCCCSDGAKTENLVAQFQQLMTPTRGLCLVGSTTCIIHSDDLVNGTQPHRKSSTIESSRGENVGVKEELSRSAVLSPEVVDETGKTTRGRSGHGLVVGCVPAALATDASEADTCGSVVTSQDAEGNEHHSYTSETLLSTESKVSRLSWDCCVLFELASLVCSIQFSK